ncbi:MAG TPA: hypothetical protein VNI01_09230, partial [Elusimicrobiota bacterium]|nr:hypothetical protein [Elusimicrobiota bacterium]
MSEEGVFVGSGSFRVDRRKALELLRDKAVEDLAFCPRFWARAAVAGGATWVRAKGSGGWLSGSSFELRFDGLPFGPE